MILFFDTRRVTGEPDREPQVVPVRDHPAAL